MKRRIEDGIVTLLLIGFTLLCASILSLSFNTRHAVHSAIVDIQKGVVK